MERDSESGPLHKVWNGMIPIELQLAPADAIELLASATLPEPFQTFYLLVPRVGYLPFISSKIKERWIDPMFALSGSRLHGSSSDSSSVKESDMWYEYKGQPLKWHYPVGLLYDMHVNNVASGEAELPWSLTLHVRKFPAARLIPSPTAQAMRDMFMAMIKEADFIRNGSTKRVMDLAKSDQMQLLDGLESHSFEQYFAIHSILVPTPDPRAPVSSSGPKIQQPKAIPLRFYTQLQAGMADDGSSKAGDAAGTQAQFHVSQCPVPLASDSSAQGEQTTLADAFRMCYEIADQAPSPAAFAGQSTCLCQGVRIPWETPIGWLAENLFYADCFLHLVVVNN
ncbi:APG5-domain-containing protein [Martensiomyces pterosporus]|nr:APG5-domain-containing protein [Martensiomyces pterosporus]